MGTHDRPTVYLETTVLSYLTAERSRNLIVAAHQQLTKQWWNTGRHRFQLLSSQLVYEEVRQGDFQMAERRLALLESMTLLPIVPDAIELSRALIEQGPLPANAEADALHVALAAVNGADYLLTWNCRHIANAALRPGIEVRCRSAGLIAPIICTPEEIVDV